MSIALFEVLYTIIIGYISKIRFVTSRIHTNLKNKTYTNYVCLVLFWFALFVPMAFRGDFAIDTIHTYDSFKSGFYVDDNVWHFFLKSWNNEFGFRVVGYFINSIWNNYIIFSCFTSFIISSAYILFIKNNSDCAWISMLVLFCSGSFYSGFNVHKTIIASSLFSLCFPLIKKGNYKLFFLCVIGISMFHFSAVILIPIYFLLRIRIKNKNNVIIGVILFLILIWVSTPLINKYGTHFLFPEYEGANAYRMSDGAPFLTILKLIILPTYILLNIKSFDLSVDRDRICINGCIVFLAFGIASSRIYMLQRFTNYFIPFLMQAYATVISKYSGKAKAYKVLEICSLLILSNINPILNYDYYFFWNNKYRNFLN